MKSTRRGWPMLAFVVVGSAAVMGVAMPTGLLAAQVSSPAKKVEKPLPDGEHPSLAVKGHLFDRQSVYAFLTTAKQAEAMADPLQRCLKYPDPPGSHWSAVAVEAYCRYRTHQVAPFEEVRSLLQRGEFDELERRLAALLQDKLNKPDMRNVLDHSFERWFARSDLELRPLLENWKHAKSQSAFAYAASGISYVAMAQHARGGQYIKDTPASNIEAMDRLIALADVDLRHAVELDSRVTPAYVAMIRAGRYSLGDAYLEKAAGAALRADPANFAIYDELMWALQPKWGGSLKQMTLLGKQAIKHAGENPVLLLLPEKELAYEADLDSDDCTKPGRWDQFSVIFDQAAVTSQLLDAGTAAARCGQLELSVVYYSEALRFYPEDDDTRVARANQLSDFDESAWALKEIGHLLLQKPHEARYVFARGYAYEGLNDYTNAEKDYLAALALDPGNQTIYAQLAGLYVNDMHDWEKAWKLDERLVELYPNEPYVWLLRAHIQQEQPRPGLKDTADYFQAHFDKSPELHQALLKMRAAQALQEGKAHAAAKATGQ